LELILENLEKSYKDDLSAKAVYSSNNGETWIWIFQVDKVSKKICSGDTYGLIARITL